MVQLILLRGLNHRNLCQFAKYPLPALVGSLRAKRLINQQPVRRPLMFYNKRKRRKRRKEFKLLIIL